MKLIWICYYIICFGRIKCSLSSKVSFLMLSPLQNIITQLYSRQPREKRKIENILKMWREQTLSFFIAFNASMFIYIYIYIYIYYIHIQYKSFFNIWRIQKKTNDIWKIHLYFSILIFWVISIFTVHSFGIYLRMWGIWGNHTNNISQVKISGLNMIQICEKFHTICLIMEKTVEKSS